MYEDVAKVIIEKMEMTNVHVLETKISTIFMIEIKKDNWLKDTLKILKFLDTIDYENYNSVIALWMYQDTSSKYEELQSNYHEIQDCVIAYQKNQDTKITLNFIK